MILASVTAGILGIFLGYLFGIWQQSRDEVLPDWPREPDYEILQNERWEQVQPAHDLDFARAARMVDNDCETIHNVPLSELIRPIEGRSRKAQVQSERILLDAVKIDRKTGEVVRVILRPGQKARALVPILRKARIRTVIDNEAPAP